MKIDCDALALEAVRFAGMSDTRAPGLAELFKMIEREAFCDGVRIARSESFAADPQVIYVRYVEKATAPKNRKTAATPRRQRQEAPPTPIRTDREYPAEETRAVVVADESVALPPVPVQENEA